MITNKNINVAEEKYTLSKWQLLPEIIKIIINNKYKWLNNMINNII